MSVLQGCSTCCILSSKVSVGSPLSLVFVRWRKPRWLPRAASKIYKFRTPTKVDPAEAELLKFHQHVYSKEFEAVQRFLRNYELDRRSKMGTTAEEKQKRFEEHWKKMVQKNEMWNFKVGMEREEDMLKVEASKELMRQKIKERDEREKMDMLIKAEQKFIKEKESYKSFITMENLDEEIDKVLDSRSDYEWALNPDGTTTKDPKRSEKEADES